MQQPARSGMSAWLILVIGVAASLATLFFPAGLILLPALWAYAGARSKAAWMVLPAGVFTAGAFMLYQSVTAAGLVVAAVGSAAALYALQTRRVNNTYTALTLSGLLLFGFYLSVCLPGILSGRGAFTDIQQTVGTLLNDYRTAAAEVVGSDAEAAATVKQYLDAFYAAVPNLVVPVLCAFAGAMGLSNLLFFRLFCRKHTEISLPPMRAFRFWTLPRSMVFGLFALLIGSLILEWSGWQYAEGFTNTVNVLIGMPLVLQGLCVLDFLLARSSKNVTVSRAITYVFVGILFGLLEMPLMLVGCFDQLFRIRDRAKGIPPRAL